MAKYTPNLNLFEPGSDDNMGIEETLAANANKVDSKVGDALKDYKGNKYDTIGKRMDAELRVLDTALSISKEVQGREYNAVRDDLQHHTIALRGYSKGAAENTLRGFKFAVEMGYWGIKSELRRSSDGKWVLFTDETLDRTTNGTGLVSSKTWAQLKALDAGTKTGNVMSANERIWSLEDFMWFCREYNMVAYLEIMVTLQAPWAQELVQIIKKQGMAKRTALISSKIPDLKLIRDFDPSLQVGYKTEALNQVTIDYCREVSNSFMYVKWDQITPTSYALAYDSGVNVDAWHPSYYRDVQTTVQNGARRVISSTVPY